MEINKRICSLNVSIFPWEVASVINRTINFPPSLGLSLNNSVVSNSIEADNCTLVAHIV